LVRNKKSDNEKVWHLFEAASKVVPAENVYNMDEIAGMLSVLASRCALPVSSPTSILESNPAECAMSVDVCAHPSQYHRNLFTASETSSMESICLEH